MLPQKRKPTVGKTVGFLKIDVLAGNIDNQEDGTTPRDLQVHRLRCHWPSLSLPLARAVAELHFGGAA